MNSSVGREGDRGGGMRGGRGKDSGNGSQQGPERKR